MHQHFSRFFTLFALLLATLAFGSAAQAQARPHLATGSAQFASNLSDFTGQGHATHLGVYTETGKVTLTDIGGGIFAVNGWAHYTAANGDELHAEIVGTLNMGNGVITATATYVGGTGRFTNATGSSALSGQMLGGGALKIAAVGAISY